MHKNIVFSPLYPMYSILCIFILIVYALSNVGKLGKSSVSDSYLIPSTYNAVVLAI